MVNIVLERLQQRADIEAILVLFQVFRKLLSYSTQVYLNILPYRYHG